MKDSTKKIVYALGSSGFVVGLVTTLSWSYSSRWFGLLLLLTSLFVMYYVYKKEQISAYEPAEISLMRTFLGIILVTIDISYNLILNDTFGPFDYGMIAAGLIIILLNLNLLKFLKFDTQIVSFSSHFIFITLILYGFLFEGIRMIIGTTTGGSNALWDWFSVNTAQSTVFVLNYIKPTNTVGAILNFDGFTVSIGYACSGIESMSVFFAAVIAYFISINEYKLKKISKCILIGGFLLYVLNILRMMIIILVGYYYGVNKMMFVHSNLGWIMFVLSMTVFWFLVFEKNEQ